MKVERRSNRDALAALTLALALVPTCHCFSSMPLSGAVRTLASARGFSSAGAAPSAARRDASSIGLGALRMDESIASQPSSRREMLEKLALVAGSAIAAPSVAGAASTEPEVTAKVFLDIKIAGRTKALENEKWEKIIARDKRAAGGDNTENNGRIVIGLYGKEAPKSVDTFVKLIEGKLFATCMDEDMVYDEDAFGVSDRDKQTKKQIYKQCKASESTPRTYMYSTNWRTIKDKRIDMGRLNKLYIVAPENEDRNGLRHDAPGIVSVQKGGGKFEFTIAPGPNPDLDKENIVIGKVLEGMGTVAALNAAPVSQGQFLEGAFKFSANVIGDVRAKTTFVNKPLQKIQVIKCGVLK